MGNCFAGKAGGGDADAAGGAGDGPVPSFSWDTPLCRKWKRPDKAEFFRRFAQEGEEGIRGARERFCEGQIPGKEAKGVIGTPEKREVRVWGPGELDGYDLPIEGLKYVDYYILDNTGQVTLDGCEDCRFFIAPCEGSVFIRNCKNCRFVLACGQLRMRDCDKTTLMVLVPGRCNVETCKRTKIACWNVSYFLLTEQLAKAHLSVWNNGWFNVHDFGTNSACELLPTRTTAQDVMGDGWAAPGSVVPQASDFSSGQGGVVPVSGGWSSWGGAAPLFFVVFSPGSADAAASVCSALQNPEVQATIVTTREEFIQPSSADPQHANALFGPGKGVKGVDGKRSAQRRRCFCRGPAVGVVVHGAASALRKMLAAQGLCVLDGTGEEGPDDPARGQAYVWGPDPAAAQEPAKYFIETMKHGLDG